MIAKKNLHWGNGSDRTSVGGEGGERNGGASVVDIGSAESGGEVSVAGERRRDGDNVGAVDETVVLLTESGEFGHGGFECALELRLVVWSRKGEALDMY